MEDNFARAVQLYGGISFIWERPMTLGLLIIAITLIFLPGMRAMYARFRAKGVVDGD
jgi:putative tricarboxylic transport membrane protein